MNASPDIVDWSIALRVASAVAGRGPETTPSLRASVISDFRELTGRSDELVRAFTGLQPAAPPPEPIVLDRAGWVRANTESFRGLIRPLAEKIAATTGVVRGPVRRIVSGAVGAQIGVLLGYLSQKVLGQYDLVLATEGGGRVYFVGPNVVEIERRLGFVPKDFRFWITLHEITHRTQFTGVPWLRDRVQTLIERAIGGMELDPASVKRVISRGKELLLKGPSAWRSATVMSLLMSDEQRALLDEMQALMCVVEGHGTFVMNRLGADLIPTFQTMREAIDARRGSASGPERTLQRAIGMDMKYDQYVLGEKFFDHVAERAGIQTVNKVWESEASMPTLAEMREPEHWLSRVGA